MFKQQTMEVNLSEKNTAILKKPSKLFNRIKSTFSGDMTPTQIEQANVMLSVIQRLNIALKKSAITNLVIVKINDDIAYENEHAKSNNDIEVSEITISKRLSDLKYSRLHSIEILAEGIIGPITFIVHACVSQKPKSGDSPIKIKVTGLLNKLSKKDSESKKELNFRVRQYIQKNCGSLEGVKSEDAIFTLYFSDLVTNFSLEIKRNFPAGIKKDSLRTYRGRRSKTSSTIYSNGGFDHCLFFNDSLLYLDFSNEELAHSLGETKAISLADELGWEGPENTPRDDVPALDNNETYTSPNDEKTSWWSSMVDDISSSGNESSCSSCGGD